MSGSDEESQGPIIRDRRRIDPVTGQARESARAAKHAAAKPGIRRGGQGPGSDTTYDDDPAERPSSGDDVRSGDATAADGPEQVASLQQAAATAAAAGELADEPSLEDRFMPGYGSLQMYQKPCSARDRCGRFDAYFDGQEEN